MPNVNNQNNSDDLFKKSIEDAIRTLGFLETKIDAVNNKTVNTKEKMTEAAGGVDEFTKALAKLDNRQLKKLTTLSSNLKAVIQNLQGISNVGVAGDSIALLVDKVKGLSDLKLDFSQLDKLGDSIEKINNSLKDFLKLSKGLSAVDLEKLTNIGITIEDKPGKTKGAKKSSSENADDFIKKIRRAGFGKSAANKEKAKIDFENAPTMPKASTLAKERLASGDYHTQLGYNINESTVEQHIEALKLYNEDLGTLKSIVESNRKKTSTVEERLDLAHKREDIRTEGAKKRREDRESAAEAKKQKETAESLEKMKEEILSLTAQLDASNGHIREVNRLTDLKYKVGDFGEDLKAQETLDAREAFRKEQLNKLPKAAGKDPINYDERIERLDKERKAKAEQRLVERELIAHRTEARLQKKLDDAEAKLDFDQKHGKRNALARLAQNTLGTSSPVLQDLAELVPILGKDFQSVQVLKDKQAQLKAEYDLENKKIDNEEMSRKQQIRLGGLSQEQKNLLNNPDLTDAQRETILKSADSQEDVINNLRSLDEELGEKREKLNKESSEKMLENEELLNQASIKAAGTLANLAIGLKIFKMSVEAIWKVTKEAAKSNTDMVASLKSMGASTSEINSDSIRFFTNELKNSEQRLKSIGRNIGDLLGGAGAGWAMIIDKMLEGIEWITDKLAKIPGMFNSDISADSEKSINYSTKVLEGIATKLDKGIDVNGVEVKIDKEVAYRALSNSFGQSKTQGFDNASSANLSSLISNMATQVQANYGVDYTTASSQISDAIFNGSNSASAYGIVLDDQILAGYAAMEKELDLVNVQYTDAYKSALRYEMAEKMMADGNSKEMQDKIKKWKQLGDVIQTASGSLFDFQEVQQIEAKDFTVPEIDAQGNQLQGLSKEQESLLDAYDSLKVEDISGDLLTIDEAFKTLNGDIDQVYLVLDQKLNKVLLTTKERFQELEKLDPERFKKLAQGTEAIGLYAASLDMDLDTLMTILGHAGLTKDQIAEAMSYLEAARRVNIDFTDLHTLEAKIKEAHNLAIKLQPKMKAKVDATDIDSLISKLRTALSLRAQWENQPEPNMPTTVSRKSSTLLSAYGIQNIDAYEGDSNLKKAWNADKDRLSVLFGKKSETVEGYTKDDLANNTKQYLKDNANPFNDGTFANTMLDLGILYAGVNALGATGGVGKAAGASTTASATVNSTPLLPGPTVPLLPGPVYPHADGGLSFKDHLARISEGNSKEVVLPLNSQETMSTLAGAISMSGILNSGGGVNVENININNDGINIADNNQAWRRVATRLADELSTLQRERGDLNYGIR